MSGRIVLTLCMLLIAGAPAAKAQDAAALYQQGIEARREGKFEDASKLLEEAAKLKPGDADMQVQLGLSLRALQRFGEARTAFERALELAPDYLDARLGLASLDYFAGDYTSAREAAQGVLERRPDDTEATDLLTRIDKAIAAVQAGREKHQDATTGTKDTAAALKQQGIEGRKAGKFEEAVKLLEESVKINPDDADTQVELGLALTPLKRFDAARRALQQALVLAPDYLDAKLGLARLDYFDKRYQEAREAAQSVLQARPGDSEALNLLKQIDKALAAKETVRHKQTAQQAVPDELRWRLDVNGGWSKLTGDRPDWWEGDARLSYKLNSKYTLSGLVAPARRFDIDNTLFEARIDHKPGPKFSDYLLVAATPDAAFFPQWAVGTGFNFRVRDAKGRVNASVLTFDARYARYITGNVRVFNPGLEQYLFNGRLWLTARWINVIDQENIYSAGYLLRGDVVLSEKWRLFGGYADAPENVDANIVRTKSIFGGLVYDMNERTTWRVSVAHDDRVDLFKQIIVGTGISRRF